MQLCSVWWFDGPLDSCFSMNKQLLAGEDSFLLCYWEIITHVYILKPLILNLELINCRPDKPISITHPIILFELKYLDLQT